MKQILILIKKKFNKMKLRLLIILNMHVQRIKLYK